MDFPTIQSRLRTAGVQIDPGLTDKEFNRVESQFELTFPFELREFLSIGLPTSKGWVDWRQADDATLQKRLDWPLDSMCFDIEHNVFWMSQWGTKPNDMESALEIARNAVRQAPTLIPIFSHRYIPTEPREPGNPIFSVYQTDIIYYGNDLSDYLQNEFNSYFDRVGKSVFTNPRRIRFWSDLVDLNDATA
jgi:hypothetical protein